MPLGEVNLVFTAIPETQLLVSCQTRFHPSNVEWGRWSVATEELRESTGGLRLLIVTEGGHPTKEQIDSVHFSLRPNPLTAIVSPSQALRSFAGALTFLNPKIRCFEPSNMEEAYRYLELNPTFAHRADMVVAQLRIRLTPRLQSA